MAYTIKDVINEGMIKLANERISLMNYMPKRTIWEGEVRDSWDYAELILSNGVEAIEQEIPSLHEEFSKYFKLKNNKLFRLRECYSDECDKRFQQSKYDEYCSKKCKDYSVCPHCDRNYDEDY